MARTKLTDRQKIYIVKRLAAYDSVAVIVRGLKEDFGITVSHAAVQRYDPQSSASRTLAQRWRDLFAQTRRAYVDATADIGGNHPLVRIHWRGEMALEAWGAGQHRIANELLDSIARETRGAPDKSKPQGHFGLRGGPLTATVKIVHRNKPAAASGPARAARKPRERKRK